MDGQHRTSGFTIVELIIVIIVIGILAILVMNTISNTQHRARDAVRADDVNKLVGYLIAYNAVHEGLPSPESFNGNDASGYHLSSTGDWLPFLHQHTNGELPTDPLNSETGNPLAVNAQYVYFYQCDTQTSTAILGYRAELDNKVHITNINVDACT